MKLQELIAPLDTLQLEGNLEVEIVGLTQDTREDNLKNKLYAALVGHQVDGHDFIDLAIEKGARAILCENLPKKRVENVSYVVVANSAEALGIMASTFFRNTAQSLHVYAVTGTNGKTSVATFISQSLEHLARKPLLLSTAGDYFNGEKISLERKAPSSLEVITLHKILREYLDKGATDVCLEATSQGLDQYRLAGISVDTAIFTNLTADHLDYHKTFEHYLKSKKRLFDKLDETAIAIVNADDDAAMQIIADTKASVHYFSRKKQDKENSIEYSFALQDIQGIRAHIDGHECQLSLVGDFNLENVVAAYTALTTSGYEEAQVIEALRSLKGVPGRVEFVPNQHKILALVDYAHSPDALLRVLKTLQKIPHNNLITVVGCGGDRDASKRPIMAKISQQESDYSIFTSDNPRTENPQKILDDMQKGLDVNNDNYKCIVNRKEAINHAVASAQSNDIILVAGKGHEDYQIIGTEKRNFDDREVLNNAFLKIN